MTGFMRTHQHSPQWSFSYLSLTGFRVAVLLSLISSLVSATWCNICDYTKADSCEDPAHFRRVDCTTFWFASKYCFKFNGTRNAVRRNGGEVSTTGVHRACELESDLETYGLVDASPGCRNLHVLNKNTSLYSTFVYDGILCICHEDDCNKGTVNFRSSTLFTLILFLFSIFCHNNRLIS